MFRHVCVFAQSNIWYHVWLNSCQVSLHSYLVSCMVWSCVWSHTWSHVQSRHLCYTASHASSHFNIIFSRSGLDHACQPRMWNSIKIYEMYTNDDAPIAGKDSAACCPVSYQCQLYLSNRHLLRHTCVSICVDHLTSVPVLLT